MGRHEARRRAVGPWLLSGAAAAVLVAVAVGAAVLRDGGDTSTGPPRAATSRTAPPLSAGTSPTAASGAATSPAAGSPSPSMMPMAPTLRLRAVGTSWVEVRGPADQVLVSRIFTKGDTAVFNQSRVHVTLGNAAAVRMTANGMPVRPGRPGEVTLMTIVRGGD